MMDGFVDSYEQATERVAALREELAGSLHIAVVIHPEGAATCSTVLLHPWSDEAASRVRVALGSCDVVVQPGPAPRSGTLYRRAGDEEQFQIPSMVQDRLWHDGYWQELNRRLGSLIDEYESETIEPAEVTQMAAVTDEFSSRYVGRAEAWPRMLVRR